MRKKDAVNVALHGIRTAQSVIVRWTGNGHWLSGAPEYLATVNIGAALYEKLGGEGYVTLEHRIVDALEHAGDHSVRTTNVRPAKGRFDIVVWSAENRPIGIVEVKTKSWRWRNVARDVSRLCEALVEHEEIAWGLVAYYLDMDDGACWSAAKSIQYRTDKIAEQGRALACEANLHFERHRSKLRIEGSSAWTAEVLSIRQQS